MTEDRKEHLRATQHEPSQYETAMEIADELGEADEKRRQYVVYIVKLLGRTQARRLLKQMQEQANEETQRTPSEVYFDLVVSQGKPKRGKMLPSFRAPQQGQAEASPGLPGYVGVAQKIAERLGETEWEQLRQIQHIVWALGQVQAWAFMLDAIELDAGEGVLVADGSRRRTVGGIFFQLAYSKGQPEAGKRFHRFPGRRMSGTPPDAAENRQRAKPVPEAKQEPVMAFTWEDRIAVISLAEAQKGNGTMKITVVGRPGKIVDQGQCVVMVMESSKVPALPKGVPIPPATPTKYTVYIGAKQWKKVAESIADPEDVLIIEGFPTLDIQTGSIAVFATNTNTKKLQQALKAKQQEASSSPE